MVKRLHKWQRCPRKWRQTCSHGAGAPSQPLRLSVRCLPQPVWQRVECQCERMCERGKDGEEEGRKGRGKGDGEMMERKKEQRRKRKERRKEEAVTFEPKSANAARHRNGMRENACGREITRTLQPLKAFLPTGNRSSDPSPRSSRSSDCSLADTCPSREGLGGTRRDSCAEGVTGEA